MNETINLSDVPTEYLQQEIERRSLPLIPMQLPSINWQPVIDMCQEYVMSLHKEQYVDDDLSHYIFEGAMTAVFGKDIWTFVNRGYKR